MAHFVSEDFMARRQVLAGLYLSGYLRLITELSKDNYINDSGLCTAYVLHWAEDCGVNRGHLWRNCVGKKRQDHYESEWQEFHV